jgi:sigma-B regulation protein RsbU (phosphoserine phosphatase)
MATILGTGVIAGDRLLLYTDGVSELFNKAGEPYGEKRLLRQIEAAATDDPELILMGIVNNLPGFAGGRSADDDQAMLMIVSERTLA